MPTTHAPEPGELIANRHLVPVPDPTVLTTAQLLRTEETINDRIDRLEQALKFLFDSKLDNVKAISQERLVWIQTFYKEQFEFVVAQIKQIEVQRDRDTDRSTRAIDMALAAAKELVVQHNASATLAVNKSEEQFRTQFTQMSAAIATQASTFSNKIDELGKSLLGQIDDIKQRVTKIESIAVGVLTQKTDIVQHSQLSSVNQHLVGMVIMAIIATASLLWAVLKP